MSEGFSAPKDIQRKAEGDSKHLVYKALLGFFLEPESCELDPLPISAWSNLFYVSFSNQGAQSPFQNSIQACLSLQLNMQAEERLETLIGHLESQDQIPVSLIFMSVISLLLTSSLRPPMVS